MPASTVPESPHGGISSSVRRRAQKLTIFPDPEFSYYLECDVESASRDLYYLSCKAPRTAVITRALTGRLCSAMQVAQRAQDYGESMFRHPGFIDGVVKIITDSESYKIIRDYGDGSARRIDTDTFSMLYMAIRLYTCYTYSTDTKRSFNRDKIVQQAREFGAILWEHRRKIFDPALPLIEMKYLERIDLDEAYWPCAAGECLTALDCLLDATKGDIPDAPSDWTVLGANLLYWAYCSNMKDNERAEELVNGLSTDMALLYHNKARYDTWVDSVLADKVDRLTYINAFRTRILSRRVGSEQQMALLTMFILMAHKPVFQREVEELYGTRGGPVLWFLTAAQRQICTRAGETHGPEVLSIALDGVMRWCSERRLSILIAVDQNLGIPLMPYLARVALHNSAKSRVTLRTVIDCSLDWVEDARAEAVRTNTLNLFASNSVRRAWITTLQKLRARRESPDTRENTKLWLRLGSAYGFNERTETAWLSEGQNAQPFLSPYSPPWAHCGWSDCLCYEQKPLYRLTACKGCYRIYYCGKLCQKNDWKHGHRETCLRLDLRHRGP